MDGKEVIIETDKLIQFSFNPESVGRFKLNCLIQAYQESHHLYLSENQRKSRRDFFTFSVGFFLRMAP